MKFNLNSNKINKFELKLFNFLHLIEYFYIKNKF